MEIVLTPREKQILWLVACGFTNREIAQYCKIHYMTVKNHLTAIYKKLNVTHRTEAVIYGASLGLISLESALIVIKNRVESRTKF